MVNSEFTPRLGSFPTQNVTGNQVTRWVYGTTLNDSDIARSDLLRAKIYPMSDDEADPTLDNGTDGVYERIEYGYNRQADTIEMKDPNETVHVYEYDEIGRAVQDRITAFGNGDLDQSVKRIGTTYDNQGNVEKVTSYDNATVGAGSVVNEVAFVYNGFGQLLDDKQEHSGAVDGSTPKVSYGYANGASGNTVRRTSITYPNGRRVDLSYGAANSHDDLLSRIGSFKINGETNDLVDYTYAGAARYVKIAYEQPGVELSYIKGASDPVGDAGDPYTGYDRFGRTIDMKWIATSGGVVKDRFQWGYDRSSNRTWRKNLAATSGGQDEKYGYDGLYQVKADARGTLNLNGTAIGSIPAENEAFNYDPTGNWLGYQKAEDGTVTVDQTRVNNQDNQVVQFDGSSALVSYDKAGNATQMPPDKDGDFSKPYQLQWDGWNRLVEIKDESDAVVGAYAYDGLYRRITKTVSGTVTHQYYSDRWKCLEEREDSGTDAVQQYVWGQRPNHRDELILRDRDTTANGTLDERLYALMDYFNCTSVVDTSGTVQERYGYSAFGVRRVMAADFTSRATSSFDWEFGFQGQFLDLESGYLNYGFRYYVPLIGRWVKRDLIEESGGDNLYLFVKNNSVRLYDKLGLAPPIKIPVPKPGTYTPAEMAVSLADAFGDQLGLGQEERNNVATTLNDGLNRGCIGFCGIMVGQMQGFPENSPNVSCFRTSGAAKAHAKENCTPPCFEPQFFMKQGIWNTMDGGPPFGSNKNHIADIIDGGNRSSQIPNNSVIGGGRTGTQYNYISEVGGMLIDANGSGPDALFKIQDPNVGPPQFPNYQAMMHCYNCRDVRTAK